MIRAARSIVVAVALVVVLGAQAVSAAPLAEITEGNLIIQLEQVGPKLHLLIKPKGGVESLQSDLTANVFSIPNPTRLVVDVPNIIVKGGKQVAVASGGVSSIRLGAHSDKTRIVLDLKDEALPVYNIRPDPAAGALVVEFSAGSAGQSGPAEEVELPDVFEDLTKSPSAGKPIRANPSQQQAAEPLPPEPTAEAAEEEVIEEDPALVVRTDAVAKTPAEPVEVAALEDPRPQQGSGGASKVKGIFYQASNNSEASSVMLDVENLSTYSLSQKDTNVYELVLENAQLSGEHLTLPQFPPDTFKGFEVLLATERGRDVVVKIYVDENVKLTPFIQKGQLWLKTGP